MATLNAFYTAEHADDPVAVASHDDVAALLDAVRAEPVIYYYVTADTEFPPNSEVPISAVRTAVAEYLATGGQRPTAVAWQATEG